MNRRFRSRVIPIIKKFFNPRRKALRIAACVPASYLILKKIKPALQSLTYCRLRSRVMSILSWKNSAAGRTNSVGRGSK
jgi:hypothetical protein